MNRCVGAAGLAIVLTALSVSGSAQSLGLNYVNCNFDDMEGTLTVTEQFSEGALIRRAGERIAVLQSDGRGGSEEVECGRTPTITNTDQIVYRLTSDGITEAKLSLARGPLAPGRTDEGPSSEIETSVKPNREAVDAQLVILGSRERDHLRAGMLGRKAGVNLNVSDEGDDPDADVSVQRPRQVGLVFRQGKGNDTLDLIGGPEMDGPLDVRRVLVDPGPGKDVVRASKVGVFARGSDGTDRLRLGKRTDIAEGGRGRDRIWTGLGDDLILPGPGRDIVDAGRGDDEIFAASGGADMIDCGPGRDRVAAGPNDRLRRCERVERVPERPLVHFGFD